MTSSAKRTIVSSLPLARPIQDRWVNSLVDVFTKEWCSLIGQGKCDCLDGVYASTTIVFVVANVAVHLFLDGPSVCLTNLWPEPHVPLVDRPERGHAPCPSTIGQPSVTSAAALDQFKFSFRKHHRGTESPLVFCRARAQQRGLHACLSSPHAAFILGHIGLPLQVAPCRMDQCRFHSLFSRLFESAHRQMHPFSVYRYSVDSLFSAEIQPVVEWLLFDSFVGGQGPNPPIEAVVFPHLSALDLAAEKEITAPDRDDDSDCDDDCLDDYDLATADAPPRERPPPHKGEFFRHICIPSGKDFTSGSQMVSQLSSSDSSDCDDDESYSPSLAHEDNKPPSLRSIVSALIN